MAKYIIILPCLLLVFALDAQHKDDQKDKHTTGLKVNALHDHASHEAEHIYKWNWDTDGLVIATSVGAWGISNFLKSSADKIQRSDLAMLDRNNISRFDRGATNNYSLTAADASDIILYTSFFLPLTHYFGSRCRQQNFAIAGMMLESFFIADGIVNILKATTKRFRPFTYNPDVPEEEKLSNGSRYSFVSGHTSNTAMIGFFSAKVFSDLYPDNKWKYFIWGTAITLPAMTGYLRYQAGKHFPTDIIGGYIIGASVGYLVPHLHKISDENMSFNVIPTQGGIMLSMHKTF